MDVDDGHGHVPALYLDGHSLAIEDVVRVARGQDGVYPMVAIAYDTRKRLAQMREALEAKLETEIMYGVNTGCGSNRDRIIPKDQLLRYQHKYICAHACGVGGPLSVELVRAMMLLRVNSFCVGNSAMTLELCDLILELLNRNIIPVIPEFGSVGASGDLIPLAHLGAVLIGLPGAKAYYHGEEREASEVLTAEKLKPHVLQPKEAMGLTNGSTLILAHACLGVYDAERLLKLANLACAMHCEAIRGERNAFDPRIHKERNQHGQIEVATEILRLLEGSGRITPAAQRVDFRYEQKKGKKKGPRVQDEYSIRCTPQVHGAVSDAIKYARMITEREINSSTDNPLIFGNDDGTFNVLSGGNFHGTTLAIPLDTLCVALTILSTISDRRIYHLLDPRFSSGLRADLAGNSEADNTGFMIAQYCTASRAMANQHLAGPASVLSIPTSRGQEDFVSNGAHAAWKLRKILGNVRAVLAVELLASAQAISLGERKLGRNLSELGTGTGKAYSFIRSRVFRMKGDRFLYPDIQAVRRMVMDGSLNEIIS